MKVTYSLNHKRDGFFRNETKEVASESDIQSIFSDMRACYVAKIVDIECVNKEKFIGKEFKSTIEPSSIMINECFMAEIISDCE